MKADADKITKLLKTARGQIEGILKMVERDAYCMDISNQILACQGVLNKANSLIIECHIKGCVKGAVQYGGANSQKHLNELLTLFEKLTKN